MNVRAPLVTAHSGCEDTPLNSIESVLAGIAAGADTIEIDVQATRDGTPVLMHDLTVSCDGAQIPVRELALDQLRRALREAPVEVDQRSVGFATLAEALDVAASHGAMLNLDVKDVQCIQGVVRLIRDRALGCMIVITGCTAQLASVVRSLAPELPVLLNAELPAGCGTGAPYSAFVKATCETATRHGCAGINIEFRACGPELIAHAERRYLPVSVWTVDDTRDMEALIGLGVHSITTYRPRKLVEILGRA